VANYEQRIAGKRKLLYSWLKKIWRAAGQVWAYNDEDVAMVLNGEYRLEITPPELTQRDTLELANTAISLVQNRIWSAERAMDRVGVEDPNNEKDVIRDEQTDATINPAAVATMANVVATFRQLNMQQQQEAMMANQQGQASAMSALRGQNPPPQGDESMNDQQLIPPGAAEAQPENGEGPAQTAEQMMMGMEGGQQ
jgi:hypothetical protein